MDDKNINNMLSKVTQKIIERLHQRQQTTLHIAQSQLIMVTDSSWLIYGHMQLIVSTVDFLSKLCLADISDPAVNAFYQALSFAVEVTLVTDINKLEQLPYNLLSQLPVKFKDHAGKILFFFTDPLLSYHKCCTLQGDYLLITNDTIITPLAMDVLKQNNITIIRLSNR